MKQVTEFLHDEQLESLAIDFDRRDLARARTATYVIHQDVVYEYARPVIDLRQRLVVLPRARHGDQRRIAHRFDVRSSDASVVEHRTDRFGNAVSNITTASVKGTIEFNARAVVTRHADALCRTSWPTLRFPNRQHRTSLTSPDDALRGAADRWARADDVTVVAHEMAEHVHEAFEYCHDVTSVRSTAAEAWQIRQGVCQDMAHVMIAMCASLGIAARYVSGHLVGDGASHAWVEVLDADRNTVIAVDPTHARRTDLRYITTATGRDYRDVAPTTGTYLSDGGHGRLTVRKKIRLAQLD